MKIGYADPPYIGCAYLYADHPDYGGEVDHVALVDRLQSEFDGWVLHASATPHSIAKLAPLVEKTGARWMTWVKGFAAFKRNVSVAYAWEPVIVKPARKPVVSKRLVMRDWIECPITLRRGLTGAKPEKVCHWAFEMVAARPDDDLFDLYPGTGAVTAAWKTWQGMFTLPGIVTHGDSNEQNPNPVGPGAIAREGVARTKAVLNPGGRTRQGATVTVAADSAPAALDSLKGPCAFCNGTGRGFPVHPQDSAPADRNADGRLSETVSDGAKP